jgi:endonuclease YncB( thermonuclease family)
MLRLFSALMGVLMLVACVPAPSSDAPAPAAPDCRVTRVVDGDTVDLTCRTGGTVRARLLGFDTPEITDPGCAAERRLGLRAKARLTALVAAATRLDTRFQGTDRYGRALVQLRLDGRDVAATLIGEGLAVPYSGGRRISWCERLA